MAHRSRICAVLFDVDEASYEAAARFWSGALGRELHFDPSSRYAPFRGALDVLVQRVDSGREGVHIDIETDDVEAEVARLEGLGARRREQVMGWWVMISPGGHPFCVVPAYSESWPENATWWE